MDNPFESRLDPWEARFKALADEAKADGLSIVVLLQYDDRFDETSDWAIVRRAAPPTLAFGMLQMAIERLRSWAVEV